MQALHGLADLFLHLDKHLAAATTTYGTGIYALLFGIVFCETGLVVLPFLPGDSLLFAAGAVSALPSGGMNGALLYPLFLTAALLGDNVNYWAGRLIGPRVFKSDASRIFKKAHLNRTEEFFRKHGPKTIILARFVPIVRTFAPFVAGAGSMAYAQFLAYSVAGAILWVGVCVTAGRLFGGQAFVQKNFSLIVLAVVAVSLLPILFEVLSHRRNNAGKIIAATQPANDK